MGRAVIIEKSGRAARPRVPLSHPCAATSRIREPLRIGLSRTLLSLMALASVAGCSSSEPQPARPEPSASSPALRSPAPAPAIVDAAAAATETSDAGASASEWRQFARKDDVPVCLFESWPDWKNAEFLTQVKPKISLRANHVIHFGVYGPGCASPECVQDPTLQCWADVEGSVITLNARYSGREKVGATCTSDCASVSAQCNTPQLAKGDYVIVYGSEHWDIRVPSVVRAACLKR
jgi:hypothetical protein